MAKEESKPIAAEKGKGKATDEKPVDGEEKKDGAKAGADGKPLVNGKKGDEPQEGAVIPSSRHPNLTYGLYEQKS